MFKFLKLKRFLWALSRLIYSCIIVDINETGKILVQYKLLRSGIKSAGATHVEANSIVAFTKGSLTPKVITVQSIAEPEKSKVEGRRLLKWSLSHQTKSDFVALVDISTEKLWLLKHNEFHRLARSYQKFSTLSYRIYEGDDIGDRLSDFCFDSRVRAVFSA